MESYSLSTLSSHTEPSRGVEFPPVDLTAKAYIGVQRFRCWAKRLAPHLAEFFRSTVRRSLEFLAFKKFWHRTWN